MWGKRRLISHKFEGTGEGGAGMCTEGWPRSCARVHGAAGCEPGVQLADARWARLAAGRVHNGCELGMQPAVARWARLSAGRVHYGLAAGGCPMGQAVSWAGAQWACSWRLPDGPGCQLCGCTMGVQLAVAWWARLSAGWVHYGRAAGGCPMGQAGSGAGALWACSWRLPDGPGWQLGGCSMGVQLAVGCTMAIPARYWGCQTYMTAGAIDFSHKIYDKGKRCCSNYTYSDII